MKVVQSWPTICNPMDYSLQGLLHCLPAASLPTKLSGKNRPTMWETWVWSQYSSLENSMDYSPWECRESDTWATFTFTLGFPDSSVGKESACNEGDPGSIPASGRSTGEARGYPLQYTWASLMAQQVKNLPAMQGTWVWSGLGGSLGEEKGYPLQYSGLETYMD